MSAPRARPGGPTPASVAIIADRGPGHNRPRRPSRRSAGKKYIRAVSRHALNRARQWTFVLRNGRQVMRDHGGGSRSPAAAPPRSPPLPRVAVLAQGVRLKVMREILRHTRLTMTLNIYSHLMPNARREAPALIDRLLAAGD